MKIDLNSLDDTQKLAQQMAALVNAGDVILLHGDLGVGKTCFARELIGALGVPGEVPSPTFTLVQSYETDAFPIYHFDLYRLKAPEEIEEIGFDEALIGALTLVEWPEKAQSYMPRGALTMHFTLSEEGARAVSFEGSAVWLKRLEEIDAGN